MFVRRRKAALFLFLVLTSTPFLSERPSAIVSSQSDVPGGLDASTIKVILSVSWGF